MARAQPKISQESWDRLAIARRVQRGRKGACQEYPAKELMVAAASGSADSRRRRGSVNRRRTSIGIARLDAGRSPVDLHRPSRRRRERVEPASRWRPGSPGDAISRRRAVRLRLVAGWKETRAQPRHAGARCRARRRRTAALKAPLCGRAARRPN